MTASPWTSATHDEALKLQEAWTNHPATRRNSDRPVAQAMAPRRPCKLQRPVWVSGTAAAWSPVPPPESLTTLCPIGIEAETLTCWKRIGDLRSESRRPGRPAVKVPQGWSVHARKCPQGCRRVKRRRQLSAPRAWALPCLWPSSRPLFHVGHNANRGQPACISPSRVTHHVGRCDRQPLVTAAAGHESNCPSRRKA
jgi:hypothetical protein